MTKLFLTILCMSLTASYCVLFVCGARLILKRAPKFFSYLLWLVVGFRLLCPWSLQSVYSLLGEEAVQPVSDLQNVLTDQPDENSPLQNSEITPQNLNTAPYNDPFSEQNAPSKINGVQKVSAAIFMIFLNSASYVWIAGVVLLIAYSLFSYLHLKKQLSAKCWDSGSYHGVPLRTANGLDTPFVLGFFKTFIYLPASLTNEELSQCLSHEYAHIRRKDHLIKQFAFILCCIYWFNPFIWLAFHLMTKDMEMSCDEIALKGNTLEDRKAYSITLLSLSSKPGHFAGCPLAFGENSAKARIKNIMNYKKPGFWVILGSILLVLVCIVGLMTNPVQLTKSDEPKSPEQDQTASIPELDPASYAAVTDRWTEYLNQPENNAFVTTSFHEKELDLNMLLYDSETFMQNAPVSDSEQSQLDQLVTGTDEIRCHYTGEQIDSFLKEKMNLTRADLDTDYGKLLSKWHYLEAYDSYTVMGIKGDTKRQEVICTGIELDNDGTLYVSYKAAPAEDGSGKHWVENGILTLSPKSEDSQFSNLEDYFFLDNTIYEGYSAEKESNDLTYESFSNSFVRFSYPANWKISENQTEDTNNVTFSDTLSDDSEPIFRVSQGEAWLTDFTRTKEDYQALFADSYENVNVKNVETMQLDGCPAVKITFQCTISNKNYSITRYETLVGYASFCFQHCAPLEEEESYADPLEMLIGTVEFPLSEDAQKVKEITDLIFTAYFKGYTGLIGEYADASQPNLFHDFPAPDENAVVPEYTVKGLHNVTASGSQPVLISCEFKEAQEDSYTYFTLEFVKSEKDWKVTSWGLEK